MAQDSRANAAGGTVAVALGKDKATNLTAAPGSGPKPAGVVCASAHRAGGRRA